MAPPLRSFHGIYMYSELGMILKEINQMYLDELRKFEGMDDPTELKAKLLHLWVTDLLEQNVSLVETVMDLEQTAVEKVKSLEEQVKCLEELVKKHKEEELKKPYTTLPGYTGGGTIPGLLPDPDGHTSVSLRVLAERLKVDVASLLELIRRVRTQCSWDVKGLIFHDVSYGDIFGTGPPLQTSAWLEACGKYVMDAVELRKLKVELESWKNRAETAEAELSKSKKQLEDLKKRAETAEANADGAFLSSKDPETEKLRQQFIQMAEMLKNAAGMEKTLSAAIEDLQKIANKDLKQTIYGNKQLLPDINAVTERLQQFARVVGEKYKSMEEQFPTQQQCTCMFDDGKMIASQKNKIAKINNCFVYIKQEIKALDKKLEDLDSKVTNPGCASFCTAESEQKGGVEAAVLALTCTICQLLELAKKVIKLVKETAEQARCHKDLREKNLVKALQAIQAYGHTQNLEKIVTNCPQQHFCPCMESTVPDCHCQPWVGEPDVKVLQPVCCCSAETVAVSEATHCACLDPNTETMHCGCLDSNIETTHCACLDPNAIHSELEDTSCICHHTDMAYKVCQCPEDSIPAVKFACCCQMCEACECQEQFEYNLIDSLCRENDALQQCVQEWAMCAEQLKATNAKQEMLLCNIELERQGLARQLNDCCTELTRCKSDMCSVALEKTQLRQQMEFEQKCPCSESHCKDQFRKSELQNAWKLLAENEKTICNLKLKIAGLEAESKSLHRKVSAQDDDLCQMKTATKIASQIELDVHNLQKNLNKANKIIAEQEKALRILSGKQDDGGTEFMCSCRYPVGVTGSLRTLCCSTPSVCEIGVKEPTGLRRILSDCIRQQACNCVVARAGEEINKLKFQIVLLKNGLAMCRKQNVDQQSKAQADAQALQELNKQKQTWALQKAVLKAEVKKLERNNERLALDLRLSQKALQDTHRDYYSELQDLAAANLRGDIIIRRLCSQKDELQAELKVLETARVAIMDKNALLEKANTCLQKELDNLKAQLDEHEHQIELSEERRAIIEEEVQDCQRLVKLILEHVKSRECVARSNQTDVEGEDHLQQLQTYQEQQQKLLGVVGLLQSELQALKQKQAAHSQDSLRNIVEKLMQDLERTAALSTGVQQSLQMADTEETAEQRESKDTGKGLADVKNKVGGDKSKEGLAAWQKEKERLLAEVTRLNELQEITMSEVSTLSDKLSSTCRILQSTQLLVVSLTKERNQLKTEVKTLKTAFQMLKKEYDALKLVDPTREVQALQTEKEVLLRKMLDFQHVNEQLCKHVEQLERKIQLLVPTRDWDYTRQLSDDSSSQQDWSR